MTAMPRMARNNDLKYVLIKYTIEDVQKKREKKKETVSLMSYDNKRPLFVLQTILVYTVSFSLRHFPFRFSVSNTCVVRWNKH